MTSTELQTELDGITALIRAAHLAGDINREDALEMRKRRLPRMIEAAMNEEDLAEIARITAQINTMGLAEKETNAQLVEAQQQVIFWQEEATRLGNIYNGLFCQSLGLQGEIDKIKANLRVRHAMAEAAITGSPVMVSDSFFAGLGAARPATPTTHPTGDPKWSQ